MEENIILTPKQEKAVKSVIYWWNNEHSIRPFVLTGIAGSGKSTLINFIVKELGLKENEISFVSFTGKAASVLNRKGLPATTIHKLIYNVKFDDLIDENNEDEKEYYSSDNLLNTIVNNEKKRIEKKKRENKKNDSLDVSFILKDKDELKHLKLIIVDEISMVNKQLLNDLMSFNIPIIACGDPFQLQPVGGESNDLINHPDVFLDEPLRQSLDSPIVYLANQIRNGIRIRPCILGNDVKVTYKNKLDDSYYINADQILCGKNVTVNTINKKYREEFLKIFTPTPKNGEKLICLKNNYNLSCIENGILQPLVNGLTCIFEENVGYYNRERVLLANVKPDYFDNNQFKNIHIDWLYFKLNLKDDKHFFENLDKIVEDEEDDMNYKELFLERKYFEYNHGLRINKFAYGYCITVHKSQGSQYKKVLLINEFLNRNTYNNWLYTAITRAEEKLVIAL